jgi:hypothetical protein
VQFGGDSAHIRYDEHEKRVRENNKKKKKIINRQRLKLDGLYGRKKEKEIIMKPDENS